MSAERNHIRVFVSSTVYEFETELSRVFAQLDGYGYDVCMSKEGTIPLDSRLSNLVNCVNAVEDCQVFLGIIRPLLGTGILEPNGRSITAQEFDRAIEIGMPRFVLADYRVEFAHKFLKLMGQDLAAIPNYKERTVKRDGNMVVERKPNLIVHGECVDVYRKAIQDNVPRPMDRIGNWAQPYKDYQDISRFVEAQFQNVERIKMLLHG
jgi:hypothetical protein